MLCVNCRQDFADGLQQCPKCGHLAPQSWDLLTTVYPPEDDLIKGFLESCGIPVILRSREGIGKVQGLTFGPLAEVLVMVPEELVKEARELTTAAPPPEPTNE